MNDIHFNRIVAFSGCREKLLFLFELFVLLNMVIKPGLDLLVRQVNQTGILMKSFICFVWFRFLCGAPNCLTRHLLLKSTVNG